MKNSPPVTPLTHKLILLVLTLILGCLAYLVFQKRDIVRVRADKAPVGGEEIVSSPETNEALAETQLSGKPPTNIAANRPAQARRSLPLAIPQSSLPPATTDQTNSDNQKPKSTTGVSVQTAVAVPEPVAGFIASRVFLRGVPPPEQVIPLDRLDPSCGNLHSEPITTRRFVVSDEGALADVFIYIKAGAGISLSRNEPAVLNQVGCEFQPYIFGLQTGQPLHIRNSDPVLHNVHTTPTVGGNIESNQAQLPKGPALTKSFEVAELFITFRCDVHPWMFAYACVVEHPWFTVTDKEGVFQIPNLPAGRYTLAAVHRKAGELTREVVIGDGVAEPITFTFELPIAGKEIAGSRIVGRDAY